MQTTNSYIFEYSKSLTAKFHHKSNSQDGSDKLKTKLLNRAGSGKSRPSRFSVDAEERVLANALSNYVYSEFDTFDMNFAQNIQAARPDWCVDEHIINKAKLLEAAKNNLRDQEILVYMGFYLVKTSRHFDVRLRDEIKPIRPDWFKNLKD